MRLSLFVACAPGLEELLRAEVLKLLGPRKKCEIVPGGVELTGDERAMMRLNLELSLASSVRLRIGEVTAKRFDAFVRKVSRLPFERYLKPGAELTVRATSRHSRLYHSGAIAERVADAIQIHFGSTSGGKAPAEARAPVEATGDEATGDEATGDEATGDEATGDEATGDEGTATIVHARFVDDVCTLSVDTSGAPLHRRGYRLESALAPLREDLARALVVASAWSGAAPLVDPLCGAGTLVIEAAMMARRLAPGRGRRFAFMDSPLFDAEAFAEICASADARALSSLPFALVGSDRDPGAIAAATANAERAGVAADVRFVHASLSDAPAHWPELKAGSALVSNMPFGQRVSRGKTLVALHQRLGSVVAALPERPAVGLLVADRKLAYVTGLDLHPAFHTKHGGIAVHAMVG